MKSERDEMGRRPMRSGDLMAKTKNTSCPRCSGPVIRKSGFRLCSKCEYRLGSNVVQTDWNRYFQGHMRPHGNADDQLPRGRKEPRRRYPLNFKGDEE